MAGVVLQNRQEIDLLIPEQEGTWDILAWDLELANAPTIGEGNGTPLQCSCLENPRTGEMVGCRVWGRTDLDTTEVT